MPVIKFTKRSLEQIPFLMPEDWPPQRLYWDEELPGFGLLVGTLHRNGRAGKKTFVLQKGNRRRRIGQYPTWSLQKARERARELIVEMDKGNDPYEEEKRRQAKAVTLQAAQEAYCERVLTKGGSMRTVQEIRDKFALHLKDWMSRPLASITRDDCRTRHKKMSKKSVAGPYSANTTFRYFRAAYNYCRRTFGLTGENPTVGIEWNKEHRRREPIPWASLPAWGQQIDAQSPIRRDYFYTVLLTGLRSADAAAIRWDDVNFETGSLLRPNPKGGPDRAFTLPLSTFLMEIFRRRKAENENDGGYVFPARSTSRTEPSTGAILKGGKPVAMRKARWGKRAGQSPHRLRDTYITACTEIGLHEYDIQALVNHRSPGGSITAGYVRQDPVHLRRCQERVTEFLLTKLAKK